MNKPSSHAKSVSPDGQIRGTQSQGQFNQAAAPSASQSAKGKAAEPKPAPKQNHDMPGPGGNAVGKGAAEKQMAGFTAAKSRDINKLKEKANSVNSRTQSKAHDKIKGKNDLQK